MGFLSRHRSVIYDFHSAPDDAPEGYAEIFDKAMCKAHGAYHPLRRHSWMVWDNPVAGDHAVVDDAALRRGPGIPRRVRRPRELSVFASRGGTVAQALRPVVM